MNFKSPRRCLKELLALAFLCQLLLFSLFSLTNLALANGGSEDLSVHQEKVTKILSHNLSIKDTLWDLPAFITSIYGLYRYSPHEGGWKYFHPSDLSSKKFMKMLKLKRLLKQKGSGIKELLHGQIHPEPDEWYDSLHEASCADEVYLQSTIASLPLKMLAISASILVYNRITQVQKMVDQYFQEYQSYLSSPMTSAL